MVKRWLLHRVFGSLQERRQIEERLVLPYKPKPFIWNRGSARTPPTTTTTTTTLHCLNPWRHSSAHIWLLAMCPWPHFQQAVWGSVPAHSLCVPSACWERQAPESCWWCLLALASGTGRSPCARAWSGWLSSDTGALWSACGSSPLRRRLELPGWARCAGKAEERWLLLVLGLLAWWVRGVAWAGGQSGCCRLSPSGWSEWTRGRELCEGSWALLLQADLQGKGEWCYQPGSPPAPSSSHLQWRTGTLEWFYFELEWRVHMGAGQAQFGACGWGCWLDPMALQAALWQDEGRRWPNVWGVEDHICHCSAHSESLGCLSVETGRRGCGTPHQISLLSDQRARSGCCCLVYHQSSWTCAGMRFKCMHGWNICYTVQPWFQRSWDLGNT